MGEGREAAAAVVAEVAAVVMAAAMCMCVWRSGARRGGGAASQWDWQGKANQLRSAMVRATHLPHRWHQVAKASIGKG